ncbi:Uncharacterised protein [Vibrio cholerae]|uniref:Uncharacterized protein n=1 Tax=Vibrio cholerae TaxID=666 RepID=A0A655ZLT9_VIBCL|nr:Uncharacterised protein [Vibrio cholerae]
MSSASSMIEQSSDLKRVLRCSLGELGSARICPNNSRSLSHSGSSTQSKLARSQS